MPSTRSAYTPTAQRRGRGGCRDRPSPNAMRDRRPSAAIVTVPWIDRLTPLDRTQSPLTDDGDPPVSTIGSSTVVSSKKLAPAATASLTRGQSKSDRLIARATSPLG